MGCAVQGSGDRDASALASLRGVRSDGPLHSLQEWIALSGCPALGTCTRSAARIMRGGSERCEQAAVPERCERAPPIHAASSRPPACTPRALAQLPCRAHDCGGVMHGEVSPVLPWSRPGKRSRRLLHAAHREASLGRGTSGLAPRVAVHCVVSSLALAYEHDTRLQSRVRVQVRNRVGAG